jgi:hypothetical protein
MLFIAIKAKKEGMAFFPGGPDPQTPLSSLRSDLHKGLALGRRLGKLRYSIGCHPNKRMRTNPGSRSLVSVKVRNDFTGVEWPLVSKLIATTYHNLYHNIINWK